MGNVFVAARRAEKFDSNVMPITNALYGTDHPSLRRGGGAIKREWEWRSPLWTHLTKGERKALRKVVTA